MADPIFLNGGNQGPSVLYAPSSISLCSSVLHIFLCAPQLGDLLISALRKPHAECLFFWFWFCFLQTEQAQIC